jgi:epoxyqueuosine reductase
LKAAVKEKALSLGFDACGVAAAGAMDEEGRLEAWLGQGYHADMTWMERHGDLRKDVSLLLPGARSVVVVAMGYGQPEAPIPADRGAVARYARGRDYHKILRRPLRDLSAFLDGLAPGSQSVWAVDTKPILERAWAAKAGVGWIGKNSLIIHPELGSWLVLGVVITTVALEADEPVPNRCGSCQRCIEACPSGAIVADGVVDSRRCVAYQSIENRGEVPADLEPAFGQWLFGCDVCQEVCPWNRKAPVCETPDFQARPGMDFPDPKEWAAMDEAAYEERFLGTALRRAKWSGLTRNARIVFRNLKKGDDDRTK